MSSRFFTFAIMTAVILSANSLYAETINTRDGAVIKARIVNRIRDTIWYEVALTDGAGKVGVDINRVKDIIADDGSISVYSPNYVMQADTREPGALPGQ